MTLTDIKALGERPEVVEKVARQICIVENVDPDGSGYAMTEKTENRLGKKYPLWQYRIEQSKSAIDAFTAEIGAYLGEREGDAPIVRLNSYYPKLPDEHEAELFISETSLQNMRPVKGGFMVKVLAINPKAALAELVKGEK